ncbi:MAG: hypothetical protein KGJ62_09545 [Armatimonadetes bacterium]|nr:hypothetical protein [Armatimonadota bacterium]MDE2205811.1 hypothetical protein [Armatimonadota bacterium]
MLLALLTVVAKPPLAAPAIPRITDRPFRQEYSRFYPLPTSAQNDVRSVVIDRHNRVWVATGAGVFYLTDGAWQSPPGAAALGACFAVERAPGGGVFAGSYKGLYRVTLRDTRPAGISGVPISALGSMHSGPDERIFAAGPDGIWMSTGRTWLRFPQRYPTGATAIQPEPDGKLWLGTISGLYLHNWRHPDRAGIRFSHPNLLGSSNILSIALHNGLLYVGTTGGIDVYRSGRRVDSWSIRNGMPNRSIRSICFGVAGRLWAASSLGVLHHGAHRWAVRHSLRWVPSDDARSVAAASDGSIWVGTAEGVGVIRRQWMTLYDKARLYERILRARHIRPPGLVGPSPLAKPGDLATFHVEDDDNDGQHTGMYCAAESFRYAVTHNPAARSNAREAFLALEQLQRITGTKWFIARSMVPSSRQPENDRNHTETTEQVTIDRIGEPRAKYVPNHWMLSADGAWWWKRDTSSDEVDGHMFGYASFYQLAATPADRRRVRAEVDRLVGGILDHGYDLVDVDGKPTRWGVWDPAHLNDDPNWYEERPGNSVEMLAYLAAAKMMTGEPRYRTAANSLLERYGYARNTLLTNYDTPAEATHIEDELLSLVYPLLLGNTHNPALLANYRKSMVTWHKSCVSVGVPLYDFVYNRWSGSRVPLTGASAVLRDWPLSWVEWTVDNRRRDDLTEDRRGGVDEGATSQVLPRSEIAITMWDGDPTQAIGGKNGLREEAPTGWLLAYWMGRYYGFITAPAAGATRG